MFRRACNSIGLPIFFGQMSMPSIDFYSYLQAINYVQVHTVEVHCVNLAAFKGYVWLNDSAQSSFPLRLTLDPKPPNSEKKMSPHITSASRRIFLPYCILFLRKSECVYVSMCWYQRRSWWNSSRVYKPHQTHT